MLSGQDGRLSQVRNELEGVLKDLQVSSWGAKAWDPVGEVWVTGAPIPIQLQLKGRVRKETEIKIIFAASCLGGGVCLTEQGQMFYADDQLSKLYPVAFCCFVGAKWATATVRPECI